MNIEGGVYLQSDEHGGCNFSQMNIGEGCIFNQMNIGEGCIFNQMNIGEGCIFNQMNIGGCIFNQMNIAIVSKTTLGKLLRERVVSIWAFPSA